MSKVSINNKIIETDKGPIKGNVSQADGSCEYLGIPFAAPPTGNLRFRKPVEHSGWGPTVLNCSKHRAASLQLSDPNDNTLTYNEDCLHLNIWTPPASKGNGPFPIFFWIHGGGWLTGSGSEPMYDGKRLASEGDGTIVVSINYRLGALGSSYFDDASTDPNCGLWDQVEALKWVHRNIQKFHGDATRITIAGESAGGGSSMCLVASPIANKLFHRAYIMSAPYTIDDKRTVQLKSKQFLHSVLGNENGTIEELRNISADLIFKTQTNQHNKFPDHLKYNISFSTFGWGGPKLAHLDLPINNNQPVGNDTYHYHGNAPKTELIKNQGKIYYLDNYSPMVDDELLPAHAFDLIANGSAKHLDIIVGSNREENGFLADRSDPEISGNFTYGSKVNTMNDIVRRCEFSFRPLGRLQKNYNGKTPKQVAEELVETYKIAEENTSGAAKQGTPQHIWNRLCSDMSFNSTTVSVAARQAKHNGNNTYAYRYDGFKNKNAFHGWEVALTFGNGQVNPRGQDFSQKIINPLINFIHTGNPNKGGGIDVEWLPWSKENISATSADGPVMHFDSTGFYVDRYVSDAAKGIEKVIEFYDNVMYHESRI